VNKVPGQQRLVRFDPRRRFGRNALDGNDTVSALSVI
jgi:hypothetical protein